MPDPLEPIDRQAVLQNTIEMLISFLVKLSEYGITTVWCWDGKHCADKSDTLAKRAADKAKQLDKIQEARSELEAVHPLARTPDQIKKFKDKLSNYNTMSSEETTYFRNLIELLGWPSVQAEGEAEKLCASLAREGLVAGVWSTDTDNYALGTPMMITGFDGHDSDRHPKVSVVYHAHILSSLGFTHEKFVDLCILLGCDFNTNMSGVGEKRVWALMEKYNSIDEIAAAEPHRPIHVLNHVRCRELFALEKSGFTHESKELRFDKEKFARYSRDVAQQYNVSHQYTALAAATRYLDNPKKVVFHTEETSTDPLKQQAPTQETKVSRLKVVSVQREPRESEGPSKEDLTTARSLRETEKVEAEIREEAATLAQTFTRVSRLKVVSKGPS